LWSNNVAAPTVGFLSAGDYSVTATDANGCTITGAISVYEPDEIEISVSPNRLICLTSCTELTAAATGGTPNYTYEWSTGAVGSSTTVCPDSTTVYRVRATDVSGCVSNIYSIIIKVRPPITATLFADIDTVCEGDPVELSVEASGGLPSYTYTIDGLTVDPPFIIYPEATHIYNLVVSDSCGSPVGEAAKLIFVLDPPSNLFYPLEDKGCAPFTVQFIEENPYSGQTYEWDFGDPNSMNHATLKNPTHIFEYPGVYDIELTVTDTSGCIKSITQEELITVWEVPDADFTLDFTIASIIDPVISFTNHSSHTDTCYWIFGDGTDTVYSVNPTHTYDAPGLYDVELIVATINGCRDTIRYDDLLITDVFTFYAPTAFTPDNDGLNDVFYPLLRRGYYDESEIDKDFNMYIFDRWGLLVFETDKYNPNAPEEYGWDGRIYGKGVAKNGVYQWYIVYTDSEDVKHEETGSVSVIR